jgi:hypothetical protein
MSGKGTPDHRELARIAWNCGAPVMSGLADRIATAVLESDWLARRDASQAIREELDMHTQRTSGEMTTEEIAS